MGSSPVSFVDDVQEALGRLSGRHFGLLLTPISAPTGRPVRGKRRYLNPSLEGGLRFRRTQLRILRMNLNNKRQAACCSPAQAGGAWYKQIQSI